MKENKFVKPARYCFQYIKNHCSKNINLNHTKKNTPKSLYQKSFDIKLNFVINSGRQLVIKKEFFAGILT